MRAARVSAHVSSHVCVCVSACVPVCVAVNVDRRKKRGVTVAVSGRRWAVCVVPVYILLCGGVGASIMVDAGLASAPKQR